MSSSASLGLTDLFFLFFFTLDTGLRRSLGLKLSDTTKRLTDCSQVDMLGCAVQICRRWTGMIDSGLGGVPREQKMLKGPLPRVIYYQVY